ncbi:hypothetical protein VKT23_020372 [Stygiomarasmius scandens]|uniref:Endopeptidase S2P n=1 Tax=Marasmiellus scandens TaxID=2682957 RepID=A0ABR1IMU0_9AGAR
MFYNFGVFFGLLGMICALGVLLYTAGSSVWSLLLYQVKAPETQVSHVKRALVEEETIQTNSASEGFIQPIIPGVTVPLSHLPLILAAVFICQLIHEFGHLLSGALESVPMLSAGMSLTVAIPSAFVSFSTAFLDSLKPSGKARIIAAGPWHNLVFWLLLVLAGRVATTLEGTAVSSVVTNMVWKDVSELGRVVVDVDEDSALKDFLPVGSLVVALDDVSISGKEDSWTNYLRKEKSTNTHSLGWCIAPDTLQDSSCCTEPTTSSTSIFSCFESLDSSTRACLDPILVLTDTRKESRCAKNSDCVKETDVCVGPQDPGAFLRLRIRASWKTSEQEDEIVLWNGPSREIWEQVAMGHYAPRFWFIPLWESVLDFWSYLNMATLSLFLFNLLPLPHLDGSQFLDTILCVVFDGVNGPFGSSTYNVDLDTESGRGLRSGSRWKQRIERLIKLGTLTMLGFSVLVGFAKMTLG